MKKISIFGSVGVNIGDEAIAVAASKKLHLIDENISVYISTLSRDTIRKYEGLNEFVIDRKSIGGWRNLYKHIKSSDIIVLGGGTMIQDKLGISFTRGMIPYMLQISILAKFLRKPVVTLPIGIDKLNTKLGRILAYLLLNNIDKLYVRDENSMNYAKLYSKNKIEPIVSVDPAFFLTNKDEITESNIITPKYITISLVNENLDINQYMPAILSCIKFVLENSDYNIFLVPMDRRNSEEISLFNKILESIESEHKDKVKIVNPTSNVYEIASILRNSKLLIGMRLHAMILSLGYTPIIGISRTTKTENFLDEFSDCYFNINKNKIEPQKLMDLVKDRLEKTEEEIQRELNEQKKLIGNKFDRYVDSLSGILGE